MHSSCREMTGYVRRAEALATGRVLFAECRPLPESGVFLHPCARFIMPVAKVKHVTFGSAGRLLEAELAPGDAVFCRPGAWLDEHFERPHCMISTVFYEEFIRCIYIAQRAGSPRNGPDVYFHTLHPPSAVLRAAAAMLAHMDPGSRAAGNAFRALLSMTAEQLEAEDDRLFSEEDRIWSRFDEWLRMRFVHDIARDDIAAGIGVRPAMLSRLVRARAGTGIREYLNALRLDYAVKLLRDELSVEEISRRCGFAYPAYFIRLFRARYGLTPGEFRKRNR